MDEDKKFYLLAEISGWNCSNYTEEYGSKIQNSSSYRTLKYNIPEAEGVFTQDAKELIENYNNLDFNPSTIKECFLLEEKVNYLALHSDPRFYINPFSIVPNYIGSISSIGDLALSINGKDTTINEIIFDDNITIEDKKKVVEEKVDYYLYDFEQLVSEAIGNAKSRTNQERKTQNKFFKRTVMKFFLDIFLVTFLLFVFTFPNNLFFSNLYNNDYTKLLTYVSYIYPIMCFITLIIDVSFYSYRARIYEPINYARRFLKKNSDLLFQSLKKQKEKLLDYIFGAIQARIELINDLSDFSILSSSYVSLDKIVNIEKEVKKLKYRRLSDISTSLSYASIGVLIITMVVYFISLSINLVI